MKKIFLALAAVGIFSGIFFGLGFHTYFITKEVHEMIPEEEAIKAAREMREWKVSPLVDPVPVPPRQTTGLAGELVRIDAIHGGSGIVEYITYAALRDDKPDTEYIRFNDVEITNGPDLYVYVSDQKVPGGTLESLGSYTDLGKLKGNMGDIVYELPSDIDHNIVSVVIWCKRFGVLFSYATLTE